MSQFPEFSPQKIKIGDPVQINLHGKMVSGTVLSTSPAGNYWIKTERGSEVLSKKNDVFPITQQPGEQPPSSKSGVDPDFVPQQISESKVDAIQTGLDIAGVADPTPASDGTNAVISIVRAMKEPKQAKQHIKNAAISAISMIPYIGDFAKAAKVSKGSGNASPAKATDEAPPSTSDVVENVSQDAQSSDEDIFKQFMDDLLRSSQQRTRQSFPNGSRNASVMERIKRRFFQDDSQAANDPTTPGGGGGGDIPPGVGGLTASNPDEENVRKNLGEMKDVVVNLTGKLGKAAAATYAYAETQHFLNRTVVEYNRTLLKFNGELTSAYAQLDANRLYREFQRAQKQAGPMSNLIRAQDEFEGSRQNLVGDWQVIATDVQTLLTKIANIGVKILDYISPFEEIYGMIRKWMPWGDNDKNPFNGQEDIKRLDQIRENVANAQKRGRKV